MAITVHQFSDDTMQGVMAAEMPWKDV